MFLLFLGLLACDKKNQDPKTEQTTEPPVEDTTTPTEETGDPSEEPQAASIVVSTNGVLLHGTDETTTVSIQVLDLSGEQIIDPLIEFEILVSIIKGLFHASNGGRCLGFFAAESVSRCAGNYAV